LRKYNTQLFKYQYSLLAFLAKNELNIKIFYKNYIFGNKNLFNGTFCHFLKKLGQMFVLKYDFLLDFSLMRILVLK